MSPRHLFIASLSLDLLSWIPWWVASPEDPELFLAWNRRTLAATGLHTATIGVGLLWRPESRWSLVGGLAGVACGLACLWAITTGTEPVALARWLPLVTILCLAEWLLRRSRLPAWVLGACCTVEVLSPWVVGYTRTFGLSCEPAAWMTFGATLGLLLAALLPQKG